MSLRFVSSNTFVILFCICNWCIILFYKYFNFILGMDTYSSIFQTNYLTDLL